MTAGQRHMSSAPSGTDMLQAGSALACGDIANYSDFLQ